MSSVNFLGTPVDLPKHSNLSSSLSSSKRALSRSFLRSSGDLPAPPAPLEFPPRSVVPDVVLPPDPSSVEGMMEGWEVVVSKESLSVAQRMLTDTKQGLEDWEEMTSSPEVEIEKLLHGETATFQERGRFKPNEFYAMMERDAEGTLKAFSSYVPGLRAYPYEVPGVKTREGESVSDAIVKYFAMQAIGNADRQPEFVQLRLSSRDAEIKKKARHICAFLKLLGDKNTPVSEAIADGVLYKNQSVVLDPAALKHGKLTTFCFPEQIGNMPIMFRVEGDEVGLYKKEDYENPVAKGQPIARYKTSRMVTACLPDREGNVSYTIHRTFTRI